MNLDYSGGKWCDRSKFWKFGHLEDLHTSKNKNTIGTTTVTLQPIQTSATPAPLIDSLLPLRDDYDQVTLPANIITATRPRFTVETIPDIKNVFESACAPIRTCAIYGENEFEAYDMVDHWCEEHGVDSIELQGTEISEQVRRWNKALEGILLKGNLCSYGYKGVSCFT